MNLEPSSPTIKAPATNFTGRVYVNPLHGKDEPSQLISEPLRFTPSARTIWHSHANGQPLHCSEGSGLVVSRDGTVIDMRAGDTVWTPPGDEHWPGDTTWLEPVSDEQHKVAQA